MATDHNHLFSTLLYCLGTSPAESGGLLVHDFCRVVVGIPVTADGHDRLVPVWVEHVARSDGPVVHSEVLISHHLGDYPVLRRFLTHFFC